MNTIEETIEEKEMNEDKYMMVEHPYEPYLVKAPCWIGNGQIKCDYVPASFARHPCDLFDKNRKREVWRSIERYGKEKIEFLLPDDAPYLWKNISGGLEVSSFGRVGIPINNKSCKECAGCSLKEKCERFHYILPQYEKCSWNETNQKFDNYNGYLVVDIKGRKETVYHLVAEAFGLKEDIFQKTKEFMKKEKLDFGDDEKLKKAYENDELEIHHIDNNGHHNTPWNGTDGNLIVLPKSVHDLIHRKS